jgi:hypothetical protein
VSAGLYVLTQLSRAGYVAQRLYSKHEHTEKPSMNPRAILISTIPTAAILSVPALIRKAADIVVLMICWGKDHFLINVVKQGVQPS